jgi:hypothetical protein
MADVNGIRRQAWEEADVVLSVRRVRRPPRATQSAAFAVTRSAARAFM